MRVLAIDPGSSESGYALLDTRMPRGRLVAACGHVGNESLVQFIRDLLMLGDGDYVVGIAAAPERCVIERFTYRSGAGGPESAATLEWSGVFRGVFAAKRGLESVSMVARQTVCAWATTDSKADKSRVNNAIAELWDGTVRKLPEALRGLTVKHTWDAAALGIYWLLTTGGYQVAMPEGALVPRPAEAAIRKVVRR